MDTARGQQQWPPNPTTVATPHMVLAGSNKEGDIPETATTTRPTTKMTRMKTTTMMARTTMKKRVGTMDDMNQNED